MVEASAAKQGDRRKGRLLKNPVAAAAILLLSALALASLLGPEFPSLVGGIIGLVTTFALSLIGLAPNGELATRALLYGWLMAGIPVGVSVVVNLLIGPAPRRHRYSPAQYRQYPPVPRPARPFLHPSPAKQGQDAAP